MTTLRSLLLTAVGILMTALLIFKAPETPWIVTAIIYAIAVFFLVKEVSQREPNGQIIETTQTSSARPPRG